MDTTPAVVLTLRKRRSVIRPSPADPSPSLPSHGNNLVAETGLDNATENPWRDGGEGHLDRAQSSRRLQHRLSFDQPSGVIMLPDDEWLNEDSDSDEEFARARQTNDHTANDHSNSPEISTSSKQYSTYYHHPERRKRNL